MNWSDRALTLWTPKSAKSAFPNTMLASQHCCHIVPPWRLRRCWWESSPDKHVLYACVYFRNKYVFIDYILQECHLRCFEFKIKKNTKSHTHKNYQVAASKDGDDKNEQGRNLLVAFLSHTRLLASVSRILIGNCTFWITSPLILLLQKFLFIYLTAFSKVEEGS